MIGLKKFKNWTLVKQVSSDFDAEAACASLYSDLTPQFLCGRIYSLGQNLHQFYVYIRFLDKVSETVVKLPLMNDYTVHGSHTYKDSIAMAMQEYGTYDGPYYHGDYSFSTDLVTQFIGMRTVINANSRTSSTNATLLLLSGVEAVDRGFIPLLDLPKFEEAKSIYSTILTRLNATLI